MVVIGVGKASMYLRWSDKQGLLIDALKSQLLRVADVDTGTLRDDLVALARHVLELYLGGRPSASVTRRG